VKNNVCIHPYQNISRAYPGGMMDGKNLMAKSNRIPSERLVIIQFSQFYSRLMPLNY
jgi:hypothetical protein